MSLQNKKEAYILAHNYNFAPLPDGLYEIDDCIDPNHRWIRLAYPNRSTRILLKYDPNELPPPE